MRLINPSRSDHIRPRLAMVLVALALPFAGPAHASDAPLPTVVPPGTALTVADQNEVTRTMMTASGEHAKLAAKVTYAGFLGGPAILEAFRAGALDVAHVGNTPPIQAHAAGEVLPIVAAIRTSEPDYRLAIKADVKIAALEDLKGKRIAYAEGTGRQPYVLGALKQAGLTRKDVKLIPLRAADFPDAIRTGQIDVAALNEPHYSRYLADFADRGATGLPDGEYARLPKSLGYLYASGKALKDPAKTAAIRDFVLRWIDANRWADANSDAWVKVYYVDKQRLKEQDGKAIVAAQGTASFPPLRTLIAEQQVLIDLIHAAGDIPKRLDAAEEFDLRFDSILGP